MIRDYPCSSNSLCYNYDQVYNHFTSFSQFQVAQQQYIVSLESDTMAATPDKTSPAKINAKY